MEITELNKHLRGFTPEIGIVLGSGLGFFAEERITAHGEVAYEELEGFPRSTVPGHAGRFIYGTLGDRKVICMQGRVHLYEGYSMKEVALPVRAMARTGIAELFLTNAAGGINPDFKPGDFMLVRDHINFLGGNPLTGPFDGEGERFPDMTRAYDEAIRARVRESARERGLELREGVYLATPGPSFETPAEIRAFATLGADAVGMSTVPEVLAARRLGLRVAALSCITNLAAGLSGEALSHAEVEATARRVRGDFADLLEGSLRRA